MSMQANLIHRECEELVAKVYMSARVARRKQGNSQVIENYTMFMLKPEAPLPRGSCPYSTLHMLFYLSMPET